MEPLKPRDKVTQHMTRDGLTLDNQTTGESVNVSSREAEQEYTAQPEGAAEKILERADELHDRHKAKKAAKDAGETVAQATGPVSRLQFTAEERASPELAPYIKKAEKRADHYHYPFFGKKSLEFASANSERKEPELFYAVN